MPTSLLNFSHRFPWGLCIVSIICTSLFLSLSYWQLQRGLEKNAIQSEHDHHQNNTVLSESEIGNLTDLDSIVYRSVELTGHFDSKHIFTLVNQHHNNALGSHIIVPFTSSQGHVYLVNRGWIPKNPKHMQFIVAPIQGQVTIRGFFAKPKHNIFIFKNIAKTEWPLEILEVDIPQFSKILDQRLFPMLVVLQSNSTHVFQAVTLDRELLKPERHWGYAAQWLIFALITMALFSYYYWNRRR